MQGPIPAVGLSMATAGAAPAPGKEDCKKGGWVDATGTYKNQGQCVSAMNHATSTGG